MALRRRLKPSQVTTACLRLQRYLYYRCSLRTWLDFQALSTPDNTHNKQVGQLFPTKQAELGHELRMTFWGVISLPCPTTSFLLLEKGMGNPGLREENKGNLGGKPFASKQLPSPRASQPVQLFVA